MTWRHKSIAPSTQQAPAYSAPCVSPAEQCNMQTRNTFYLDQVDCSPMQAHLEAWPTHVTGKRQQALGNVRKHELKVHTDCSVNRCLKPIL